MAMLKTLATASLLLGSVVNSHMFISSPSPIAGTFPKDPLDPSGSNFPCHGVPLPNSGGQSMEAGSTQTLSFELAGGANTAVHGGGSCQISITYETDPAKQKDPSNWKVIYSMLGGCPADTVGNLNSAKACTSENEGDCVNEYPFTIPKGVKSGHAILAWTWFNTVGNREMYMNCVNAQFTGGDGSEMSSLPAMFVANLASVDKCPTTESMNVNFPSPGKYRMTKTEHDPYPLALPTGDGCSGGGAAPPAAPPAAAPSSAPAPTSAPASSAPAKPTTPIPVPAPVASTTAPQIPASTLQPSFVPSGKCAGKTVPCPIPGQVVCIDSSRFGICDIDFCALPEAVAPGTMCSNGVIMRKVKRHLSEHDHSHKHAPRSR